jgi:hypothetical protein
MKKILFFLLLPCVLFGQDFPEEMPAAVAVARSVSVVDDTTLVGTLTGVNDVMGYGLSADSVQIGDKFIDAAGRIHTIELINSRGLNYLNVQVVTKDTVYFDFSGRGVLWRPDTVGLIPIGPAANGMVSDVLAAKIYNHNLAILSSVSDTVKYDSLIAGANITIDYTDPRNPVISSTGGGGSGTVESVVAGTGISVDVTDPANPIVTNTSPDQVVSLNEGSNVTVSGSYPNFTITVPSLDDGDADPTNELYDDAELRDSLAEHRIDIDAIEPVSLGKSVVFFGFGQSNMDGRDPAGDLSTDPLIIRLNENGTTETATTTNNTPIFQAAKAHRRKYPLDTVYILKIAQGGTSISEWASGGSLRIDADAAIANHSGIECHGIFWLQGESDRDFSGINALNEKGVADSTYYDYFYENVYPWMAGLFGDNPVKVVLGQLSDVEGSTYWTIGRNSAINRMGRDSIPNTSVAVTYDLETYDGLHFDGAAVDTIGQLMHDVWEQTPYYELGVDTYTRPTQLPTPFFDLSAFRFPADDIAKSGNELTQWASNGYTFVEQQTGATVGYRLLDFAESSYMESSESPTVFDRDSIYTFVAVVEVGADTTGEQIFYAHPDADSRFGVALRDGELSIGMFDGSWSTASVEVSPGDEIVLIGQCDGSGNISAWANGEEATGTALIYTNGGGTVRHYIGALNSTSNKFGGKLGALIAYDEILDLKEIKYLSDSLYSKYFANEPYEGSEVTFALDNFLDQDIYTLTVGSTQAPNYSVDVTGNIGVDNTANNVLSTTLTDYTSPSLDPADYGVYFENDDTSGDSYGIGFGTVNATQRLGGLIAYRQTDINNKGELAFYNKQDAGLSALPELSLLLAEDGGVYTGGFTPYNLPLSLTGGIGVWANNLRSVSSNNDANLSLINDLYNWSVLNDRNVTTSISLTGGSLSFYEISTAWQAMSFDPANQVVNVNALTDLSAYDDSGPDNIVVASGIRGELGVASPASLSDGNGILEDAGPHTINEGTTLRWVDRSGGSVGRAKMAFAESAGGSSYHYWQAYGNDSRGALLSSRINETNGEVVSATLQLSDPFSRSTINANGKWYWDDGSSYRGIDWDVPALRVSGSDFVDLPNSMPPNDGMYWGNDSDGSGSWQTSATILSAARTSSSLSTSSTFFVTDSQLQITGIPAGVYEYTAKVRISELGGNSYDCRVNATSYFTNNSREHSPSGTSSLLNNIYTSSADNYATEGVVHFSGTGTFYFEFAAQSGSHTVQVLPASYIKLTKID